MSNFSKDITREHIIEMSITTMAALQKYNPSISTAMDVLMTILAGAIAQIPTRKAQESAIEYFTAYMKQVIDSDKPLMDLNDLVATEMGQKH